MPANDVSLRLTDAYRARLLLLRQATARTVAAAWQTVTLDDLDGTFQSWLAAAAPAVTNAQAVGVGMTGAYLGSYVSSELGRAVPAPATPSTAVGRDRFGRPMARALAPALITVKLGLKQGLEADRALAVGLNRAVRVTAGAVLDAPRAAEHDAIAEDSRIVGWRRATSGNPCGACMAAATGAVRDSEEVLEAHDHCRCFAEPVVRGVRERVHRPTGDELWEGMSRAEQDALFAGRGGAEKADAIRGGVPLDRLITRQPQELGGVVMTETPLSALADSTG